MTQQTMRTLAIGDLVTTPSGQAGILRWTGRVNGKPIEYAGVELTSGQGLHSGEHEGHKYFEVSQPGSGIFVSYSKLVSANSLRGGPQRAHALHTAGVSRTTSRHARQPSTERDSKLGFHFGAHPPAHPHKTAHPPTHPPVHPPTHAPTHAAPPAALAASPAAPAAAPAEIRQLRALLEEKEARIKDLKASRELQRSEFRLHIQSIEADRNQIAEHYEAMLRSTPSAHEIAEIEVQRTALAAMQNKLMEENEQMRQSLEQAQRDAQRDAQRAQAAGSEGDGLDSLLHELNQQEARLAELQESVQELDALRQENQRLRERSAEMEAHLDEVVALKDSLAELSIVPPPAPQAAPAPAPQAEPAELQAAHAQIEQLKESLAALEKRAQKNDQEAKEARKEAQAYFKASIEAEESRDRIKLLEKEAKEAAARIEDLEHQLAKRDSPATPARTRADHEDFVFTPSPSTRLRSPAHAKPPSRPLTNRELEDQILREAGLLDHPPQKQTIDPAAGRDSWCGLCEKGGHTTVDCPFDD